MNCVTRRGAKVVGSVAGRPGMRSTPQPFRPTESRGGAAGHRGHRRIQHLCEQCCGSLAALLALGGNGIRWAPQCKRLTTPPAAIDGSQHFFSTAAAADVHGMVFSPCAMAWNGTGRLFSQYQLPFQAVLQCEPPLIQKRARASAHGLPPSYLDQVEGGSGGQPWYRC